MPSRIPTVRPPARSGAPGPVVSERRPVVAAAVRRSGIASWAVAVASVCSVIVVITLRFGASGPTAGSKDAIHPPPDPLPITTPTVTQRTMDPPHPGPTAAPLPDRTAEKAAAPPPTSRAVEPARVTLGGGQALPQTPAPPVERAPAVPPVTAPTAPPHAAEGAEFDRGAARAALAAAAAAASGCKTSPDDPVGGARVSVTFAPSGRVITARVESAQFQGTRTGGCIAATFRTAAVPPFAGDPVMVSKDVIVR